MIRPRLVSCLVGGHTVPIKDTEQTAAMQCWCRTMEPARSSAIISDHLRAPVPAKPGVGGGRVGKSSLFRDEGDPHQQRWAVMSAKPWTPPSNQERIFDVIPLPMGTRSQPFGKQDIAVSGRSRFQVPCSECAAKKRYPSRHAGTSRRINCFRMVTAWIRPADPPTWLGRPC